MVGIETKADFIEFQHGMTFGADNLGKKKEEKKNIQCSSSLDENGL